MPMPLNGCRTNKQPGIMTIQYPMRCACISHACNTAFRAKGMPPKDRGVGMGSWERRRRGRGGGGGGVGVGGVVGGVAVVVVVVVEFSE